MPRIQKGEKRRPERVGYLTTHTFGIARRWVEGPCIGCGLVAEWSDNGELGYRVKGGAWYPSASVPRCPDPAPSGTTKAETRALRQAWKAERGVCEVGE